MPVHARLKRSRFCRSNRLDMQWSVMPCNPVRLREVRRWQEVRPPEVLTAASDKEVHDKSSVWSVDESFGAKL